MSPLVRYTARRLAFAALLVFVVSSAAVLLARIAPGDFTSELVTEGASADAVAREQARVGLDRSVGAFYADWLARAARLDFGRSFKYGRPVGPLVAERARNTALLAVAALAVATIVGIPLGLVAGTRRGWPAALVRTLSVTALSLPPLVLSIGLVFLAARVGWLGAGGASAFVLAVVALAVPIAANLERLQARAVADVASEPCLSAAAARGVPARRLRWRHQLRLSLAPVVSVYGLIAGSLLSGSFIVEIVTAWPGLGRLMYDALVSRDVNLVAGCAAAGAVFVALGTLVSDVLLAWADPRVRASEEAA